MKAQYDEIAQQYQQTKESPLRRHVEAHSFLGLIGDVRGLSVLDLACGEGFYTRKLNLLGADRVVGVDISAGMLDLARAAERSDPRGIEYVCADVATMPDLGQFDLVVAAYLLHYSPDSETLCKMCGRIAGHLRGGGRFVTLNENPDQPAEQYAGYTQYGFNKTVELPRVDGSPITYWLVSDRSMIRFQAHYYGRGTYEKALADAGFEEVSWHPLRLADGAEREMGPEYWREYMENPPVIALECRMPDPRSTPGGSRRGG